MGDGTTRWPVGRSQAVARGADALLRAVGGTEVTFLFPLSIGGGTLSELGAAGQTAEQVIFAGAAVRSLIPVKNESKIKLEVLISAAVVNAVLDARQVDTGQNLFEGSLGMLHEGRLLRIRSVVTEYFAEAAYAFRVTVTD